MKLQVGDVIEIHGWVMLAELNDGQKYKVASIEKIGHINAYVFTKARGKKVVVIHNTHSVDAMIGLNGNNSIEIV